MVPLSAEGGEGWRRSRQKLRFRVLRTRTKGFAIALWKPSLPAYKLVSYPALVGRGGSVSRRDHNRAYRRRTALAWAHKSKGTYKPIPSCSSGEGGGVSFGLVPPVRWARFSAGWLWSRRLTPPLSGEPLGDIPRKASPERGGARHRRAEGFVPHAARSRRLCQPP